MASLSSCHMLWYLHLCAVNKVVVLAYRDATHATMLENEEGGGCFIEVRLRPLVTLAAVADLEIKHLHHEAHAKCYIAASVNFLVLCEADFRT